MSSIFVANFIVGEKEGIYKKIYAEAKVLKQMYGECYLVLKTKKGCKVISVGDGSQYEFGISVLHKTKELVKKLHLELIYVRAMIPNPVLINVLRIAKKNKMRIIYEIPTYPYFAEMYRMAKKKYRALIKIMLDVIYNPIIFHYAERILIVKSNSQKRIHKKMVEMCNGLNVDDVESKVYATPKALNELNLVAVGTIYPYHGYDRLIEGMRLCNEKIDGIDLKLHFIGASETMNKLEELSKKYQLKHVFFYGEKTTKELNEMYKDFDIGVGCLGLHRKNADIDTSLKVIEYYCRGVPVISSAQCLEERYTLFVSADDSPINMKEVVDFYRGVVDSNEYKDLSVKSKLKYSWEAVLGKALM